MVWFWGLSVLLYSCSETKMLEPGQYLYDGAKVNIKSDSGISRSKYNSLKHELHGLLRPKPNGSFLGIRFKLLLYNLAGKGKGLRNLIRKMGEPPVIASYTAFEKNRSVLQNRLENIGYFKDSVILDTVYKAKKLSAAYTAVIGKQYTIRNVSYPSDPDSLSQEIARTQSKSLLKKGDPYNLDVIKSERSRIDGRLKQIGYYYFSPENLIIRADTMVGDQQVDMTLVIKRGTSTLARNVYHINNVVIFADYNTKVDSSVDVINLPKYKGYTIIDQDKRFKPSVFTDALAFKPGDLYNRRSQDLSLSRLVSLGVFRFVKIRFDEKDTAENKLDAYYYLSPATTKSLRFEVSALSQSNDGSGGQLSVNWRNRNIFHGAELFMTTAYFGFLTQFHGNGVFNNTTKYGLTASLLIPRILGPFNVRSKGGFIPKAKIDAGYEFYNSTNQYTLNTSKAAFSYVWKNKVTNEHRLEIIRVIQVNPTYIDSAYQLELDTNAVLARSLEKAFIIGPTYNFNVNTQLRPNQNKNNFYFNANVDLSANILGIASGADVTKGNEKKIFGVPYSQYMRGELDFRHYLSLSPSTVLVSRLDAGIGYAYGNSTTLPFIEAFFAGGANDIRSFRSRSLGPGSYYVGNPDTTTVVDQPGDIKMEMNAEFRFKVVSIIRWAFFVDAGNIWTLRYDSSRVGSQISKNFLNQVGVGVGTGIRFDINILILRFDWGIPIREPWLAPKNQWVFDVKNSVLNFAIGYPF